MKKLYSPENDSELLTIYAQIMHIDAYRDRRVA
jgi:hypothetical protein